MISLITDREIKNYLKNVQRNCPSELRAKIKADLENNLYEFCEENPQADWEKVIEHFGTPEAYASGFAQAMSIDKQTKTLKKAYRSKWWIILVCALLVLLSVSIAMLSTYAKKANEPHFDMINFVDESTQNFNEKE